MEFITERSLTRGVGIFSNVRDLREKFDTRVFYALFFSQGIFFISFHQIGIFELEFVVDLLINFRNFRIS